MCNRNNGGQDRSDLIKLAKILVLKSSQLILQSRDGNKVYTKCDSNFGGENNLLFTLGAAKDVSNISSGSEADKEVKKLIGITTAEIWPPLCVEIFLKTADDEDVMSLEIWRIALTAPEICKDYAQLSSSVYNRLETFLKSLIAISRVLPAYRYSRKQSPSTFLIHHRIHIGEPAIHTLGDGAHQRTISSVSMPVGTLTLTVAYRTLMLISPQCSRIASSSSSRSSMKRSDHFSFRPPEFGSARKTNYDSNNYDESSYNKFGAFAAESAHHCGGRHREKLSSSLWETEQLAAPPPFSKLLTTKKKLVVVQPTSDSSNTDELNVISSEEATIPTAAPSPLLLESMAIVKNKRLSNWSSSINDDFIMVDMANPPFAELTDNTELGMFYQEWQTAPPLQICPDDPPVIEQVGDLTAQLNLYETSLQEFDRMVSSLHVEDKPKN